MPELEITAAGGGLHSFAREFVLATTAYPEDAEKRQELLAVMLVDEIMAKGKPLGPNLAGAVILHFPFLLETLHQAPRADEVYAAMERFAQSSWTAGEILLTAISAGIHHPELDVTLSKVIDALSKRPAIPERGVLYTSKRSLWKAWGRFRTVSHFYAVRQLWLQNDQTIESFSKWQEGRFKDYLAQAEEIRRQAVARRFLGHEESWRVPASLTLPKVAVRISALDPKLIRLIRDAKPEHSRF